MYTYSEIINYLRSYYLPPFYVITRIFVEDTFLHLGQFLKVLLAHLFIVEFSVLLAIIYTVSDFRHIVIN